MRTLCSRDDLNQHPTFGATIDGEQYLVLMHEGQVKAYINRCPHLSIPLEWEEHAFVDQDTGLIRCSTHGALFMPDSGECVSGPCYGDKLQAVAIHESNGIIYLS